MCDVHSYMSWTHIPDIDANMSSADYNPFGANKQQPLGKVSVNLPTDDGLCRNNGWFEPGQPSRSSKTGGLQGDQFVKHSKSHAKWYGLHFNQDRLTGSAGRESTYACNQAAALSRCPSKVQQGMQTHLKGLQNEQTKGKSAGKVGAATEELQYLMNFRTSITDFAFVSMANVTLVRRDACEVRPETGYAVSLTSSSSGLAHPVSGLCVEES